MIYMSKKYTILGLVILVFVLGNLTVYVSRKNIYYNTYFTLVKEKFDLINGRNICYKSQLTTSLMFSGDKINLDNGCYFFLNPKGCHDCNKLWFDKINKQLDKFTPITNCTDNELKSIGFPENQIFQHFSNKMFSEFNNSVIFMVKDGIVHSIYSIEKENNQDIEFVLKIFTN